ncbi:hypothetical protein C8R43DRAFT_587587 [Mycena crocata]|nr:hypothetical protein C8R43DRAFT_587587 [Mycena crocata]
MADDYVYEMVRLDEYVATGGDPKEFEARAITSPSIEDTLKDTLKWNADYERMNSYFSPLMCYKRDLADQAGQTIQMRDARNAQYPLLVGQTVSQQVTLIQDIFTFRNLCFDEKWQSAEVEMRKKHVLVGLAAACSGAHNLHATRKYCPELSVPYLSGDARHFLDLLKSVIPEDMSAPPTAVTHFAHPDWDAVCAHHQRSNPGDFARRCYEETLILRTKLISLVLQATFRSFLGLEVPTIKLSKVHAQKTRFGPTEKTRTLVPPGAQLARTGCHLTTCPNGMYDPAEIPKEKKFLRCKECWDMFAREVKYCSQECQKADWKPNHKAICGKPLDFDTVAKIAAPAAPAPTRFTRVVGPAKPGFTRSTALSYIVSQLCLRPEADYLIMPTPLSETVVDFVDPEAKARFREFRETALTAGDKEAIAVITQAICWWASLDRYGGPVTADIVVDQFRMEFSFPSVKPAIIEMEQKQLKDLYKRPCVASLFSELSPSVLMYRVARSCSKWTPRRGCTSARLTELGRIRSSLRMHHLLAKL